MRTTLPPNSYEFCSSTQLNCNNLCRSYSYRTWSFHQTGGHLRKSQHCGYFPAFTLNVFFGVRITTKHCSLANSTSVIGLQMKIWAELPLWPWGQWVVIRTKFSNNWPTHSVAMAICQHHLLTNQQSYPTVTSVSSWMGDRFLGYKCDCDMNNKTLSVELWSTVLPQAGHQTLVG